MKAKIIFFSLLLLFSCKTIWYKGEGEIHPIDEEYFTDVNRTIDKVENKTDTFAYMTLIYGNCFGSSVSANAHFTWTQKGKMTYSLINKPPRKEYHDIKTVSCDNHELFNYFVANRLDTITTLPKPGNKMWPTSQCTLKVKFDKLIYTKVFEEYPFFTTKDTLHPIFIFVQKLYGLK